MYHPLETLRAIATARKKVHENKSIACYKLNIQSAAAGQSVIRGHVQFLDRTRVRGLLQ